MNKQNNKLLGGLFFVLFSLTLLGFGCAKESAPGSKQAAEQAPDAADTAQVQIPEGWKVYESSMHDLSFAYPQDWHVLEHERMGILVSNTPFPDPLPPDILGVPVVIGTSSENVDEVLSSLLELDPEIETQEIVVNNKKGLKYTYKTTSGPRILYFFPGTGRKSVEVGIDQDSDLTTAVSIINTLSF